MRTSRLALGLALVAIALAVTPGAAAGEVASYCEYDGTARKCLIYTQQDGIGCVDTQLMDRTWLPTLVCFHTLRLD